MKINKDFMIREIAGETVLVATGQASEKFNGMITLNDVGSFIVQNIEDSIDENHLASKVLHEFEVDEDMARQDIRDFVGELLEVGIILQS